MVKINFKTKTLESWFRDAACFIRKAQDAANVIHDMEGQIEIGDTFKNPKFRDKGGKLRTFDRVVATAPRDSTFVEPASKLQSVPEGQDKRKVIDAEARETDKALDKILKQLGV